MNYFKRVKNMWNYSTGYGKILLIIFLLSLFLSKIIFLDYLIINLGVKVAIIFLVFLLMMYLLKFEEITLLKKIYNSKFRKHK